MSALEDGRPNLKISCDNNLRTSEIQFVDANDEPEIFPYKCYCQKDPCECGCSDISEEDIQKIFDSLEINSRDEALGDGIRLNTVHVWGTAELSSDDILGFFGEYNPQSIEWINDDTCNVVFERESSAFRALHHLTEPLSIEAKDDNNSDDNSDDFEDDSDRAVARILARAGQASMDLDSDSDPPPTKRPRRSDRPALPYGRWRRAVVFPDEADGMCMRYALAEDRKQQGAERKSRYYQRHGNPNYGGVKGIISDSFRRRMRLGRRPTSPSGENTRDVNVDGRTAVSYGELYSDPSESESESEDRRQSEGESERPAARGMRMKADEEEAVRKDRKIHSRLGGRRGQSREGRDLRDVLSRKNLRRDRSPMDSRLKGRLGPQSDTRNPGSEFMRRRRDFYFHDDRQERKSRPEPRDTGGRWKNDKFFDSD